MYIDNGLPEYLEPIDAELTSGLGIVGACEVFEFLAHRAGHTATPLIELNYLAGQLGIAALSVKDEGRRLDLGSFKALGGAFAVTRLVLDEASRRLHRKVGYGEVGNPAVRSISRQMTFSCASDGNHGRSVAYGARLAQAKSVVFLHAGVSAERAAAIEVHGALVKRVDGNYDDSVDVAERCASENGWTSVSDTSHCPEDRVPLLVMQGYTALAREIYGSISGRPSHVFVQAGVGGLAAAVFAHLSLAYGKQRPKFIVVEPERAACVFESARTGRLAKAQVTEPTLMAMLECYEPSAVAWRVLSRLSDGFMTITEQDAKSAMIRLAYPSGRDPAIVAGESGAVGLAGAINALGDPAVRAALSLNSNSRILVINTEGATDQGLYSKIVGRVPGHVLAST